MKIFGLALGNGFAALAGSVIAQNKGSADQQMGIGMVVLGLASVIIGLSLFRRVKFMKGTTMVILGSLVYKAAYQIVLLPRYPDGFQQPDEGADIPRCACARRKRAEEAHNLPRQKARAG